MIYVLDTDMLSLLAHKDAPEAPRIRRRIAELPPDDSVVSTVINYEEQMRGWLAILSRAKTPRSEMQAYTRLLQHLVSFRRIVVLPFDDAAMETASNLRARGIKIGSMDLKIASIVLAKDASLVTRNFADFRRVPNLRIEDWSTV